ncbi:hypothetical protein D3C75_1133330 [compost metagenome]
MAVIDFTDFRIIIRAGAQLVERNAILQIVYIHPAAQQVAHFLVAAVLHTVRQNLRQTVQQLKLQLLSACIFDFHPPDKRSIIIIWQVKVMYGRLQSMSGMSFLNG